MLSLGTPGVLVLRCELLHPFILCHICSLLIDPGPVQSSVLIPPTIITISGTGRLSIPKSTLGPVSQTLLSSKTSIPKSTIWTKSFKPWEGHASSTRHHSFSLTLELLPQCATWLLSLNTWMAKVVISILMVLVTEPSSGTTS